MVDGLFDDILSGWRRGSRGPLPQLTSLQVLAALILIRSEGPVGRRLLSQSLGINDGVARGLLERLSEKKLIMIAGNGASLSETGRKRLDNELGLLGVRSIQELGEMGLVPGKSSAGVHLSGRYREGLNGIRERDEAVRVGADGSITMAMLNGRLVVPPDNKDVRDMSPEEDARLRGLFGPSEKDLLIIGFAGDSRLAMVGALAAVLSLAR